MQNRERQFTLSTICWNASRARRYYTFVVAWPSHGINRDISVIVIQLAAKRVELSLREDFNQFKRPAVADDRDRFALQINYRFMNLTDTRASNNYRIIVSKIGKESTRYKAWKDDDVTLARGDSFVSIIVISRLDTSAMCKIMRLKQSWSCNSF